MLDGSAWLLGESPSIEVLAIRAEDAARAATVTPAATDPRTRVLSWLLGLLGSDDRELLELTMDGSTLADVARRQGRTRRGLADRRDLLLAWLAYCAPIHLEIDPVLAGLNLTTAQTRWWVWHEGRPSASLDALALRHPALAVDRGRWLLPIRRIVDDRPIGPRSADLLPISPVG